MTVDERRLYTHLLPCRYCGRMPMLESSTKTLIVCDSDNQILHGVAGGEIKHRMTCHCGGHSHLKLRDAITEAIYSWNVEQQSPMETRWSEGAGGAAVYYDTEGKPVRIAW